MNMSTPSHSELSLLRSCARLSDNNHIPATEADNESENVVEPLSAFRFASFRAGRMQVASKNTQRSPVNHREKLAIDLQESRNCSDRKENSQKHQNEKKCVVDDTEWAHKTYHRKEEEQGEDVQSDIEAGLIERDPAEFLNVLRRLKEKHEKNLKRVEEMYYGSSKVEELDSKNEKEMVFQ